MDTTATGYPVTQRVSALASLEANIVSLIGNHLIPPAIPWLVPQTIGNASRAGFVR